MAVQRTSESAQQQYKDWEETRPPLSYDLKRRKEQYPQLEEGALFCLEAKVFYASQFLPVPPAQASPDHPIHRAYHRFQRESEKLQEKIVRLREIKDALGEEVQEDPIRKAMNLLRICVAACQNRATPVQAMDPHDKKKEFLNTREQYHSDKKRTLQGLITYITLYLRFDPENQELKDLQDQDEAIYLAHQTYSAVKTVIHDKEPTRESGEIVMNHVYDVCVAGINKFLKKINKCQDPKEKRHLYQRLKINIVVRLCHDMKEDRKAWWDTGAFQQLLLSMTRFDSRYLNLLFEDAEAHRETPQNPHFISNHWEQIDRMIDALSKPPKEERNPGYLRQKILDNPTLTPEEVEDVLDIKNDDRKNNIDDLKYMKEKPEKGETPLQRQIRKTEETFEILQMNLDHHAQSSCEQSLDNVILLSDCCNRELDRLEREYSDELEPGKVISLKAQFKRFREEALLKKAA
jgi:hypothetical protein